MARKRWFLPSPLLLPCLSVVAITPAVHMLLVVGVITLVCCLLYPFYQITVALCDVALPITSFIPLFLPAAIGEYAWPCVSALGLGLLFFSFPFFFNCWYIARCLQPSFESGFDHRASCRVDERIDLPFELLAGSIEWMLRTGFKLFVSAVSCAWVKKKKKQSKNNYQCTSTHMWSQPMLS